jgi:hypothetical protein
MTQFCKAAAPQFFRKKKRKDRTGLFFSRHSSLERNQKPRQNWAKAASMGII